MSYHGVGAEPAAPLEPGADYRGDIAVPGICPPCAYLDQGACRWCPDNAVDIPGCEGCVDHQLPQPPWWQREEVVLPALLSVATTVAATIVTAVVMRQMRIR